MNLLKIKLKILSKLGALSVVSGACLAAPFLHYSVGWLCFVSLMPFLYLIRTVDQVKISRLKFVFFIWLAGFVMMAITVLWLAQINFELLTGTRSIWVTLGLGLTYLSLALTLSMGFVIFGYLYKELNPRLDSYKTLATLPAAWVVCEYLRSHLYSIVMLGQNGSLGPNWNFGDLGFAVSVTPLVYIGRIFGLYGLSFIVVMLNIVIFWLVLHGRSRWRLAVAMSGSVLILGVVCFASYSTPKGQNLHVGAVQLAADGSGHWQEALKEAHNLDLVVFPEYSSVLTTSDKKADREALTKATSSLFSPAITSRERMTNAGERYNTVTVYDPRGDIVYEHDKRFLIPIGEAIPYSYEYLYGMLGQSQTLSMVSASREVTKGSLAAEATTLNGIRFAPMACSGAISPGLYRAQVRQGAEIITNSASLYLFAQAPMYHQQTQQMARFIAVSNARPFVQATKGGFSVMLDHNGVVRSKSKRNATELIESNISTNNKRTPYSFVGEWFLGASFLMVLFEILRRYTRGIRRIGKR